MKIGYYSADTTNGVSFYDDLMDLDVDIMSVRDFRDSLDTLEEGEIIYTFFDQGEAELFDEIKREYGIQ